MSGPGFYQFLVRLHPRTFRERFGPEMVSVFDEAPADGKLALFADCLVSLARQWVLRSALWIIAVAGLGALAQMALAGSAWRAVALSTRLADLWSASRSLPAGGIFLLAAGILTAILLGVTIAATLVSRRAVSGMHKSLRRAGVHK